MAPQDLTSKIDALSPAVAPVQQVFVDSVEMLNVFAPVFIAGFLITLAATPVVRRLALIVGVVDTPDSLRKHHKSPVAYLGGVAVFIGFMAAMLVSSVALDSESGVSTTPTINAKRRTTGVAARVIKNPAMKTGANTLPIPWRSRLYGPTAMRPAASSD